MHYEPIDFNQFPEDLDGRWEFIEYFIGCWFEPVKPADGYDVDTMANFQRRLSGMIPPVLERWAKRFGHREDIWKSLGDNFIKLARCESEDGYGIFPGVGSSNAFSLDMGVDDPELIRWPERGFPPEPWGCRLSDHLLKEMIHNVWWGAGERPIPYFTKGIMIPPEEFRFSRPDSQIPDQRLELDALLTPGLRHHFWFNELHGKDLLFSTCYPNTFLIAARNEEALAVLPEWFRHKIEHEPDSLEPYQFYRNQ
ncbi:hypothetical protein [Bremerella sp.]|uniref:hypothetical protein n=1 Tax=Bremerella sp. TaxID=2795602 RepID=UPI003918C2F2